MRKYTQLTREQRYQIRALREVGETQSRIAEIVGVHKSTISREIARNSGERGYYPKQAHTFYEMRKLGKYRGLFVAADWSLVDLLLEQQWSPEQISLWLKSEGLLSISHETIYQYILRDKSMGGDLYTNLRERKKTRKRYGGGKDRRGEIPNKVLIDERSEEASNRSRPGADWEADLIIGAKNKQAIVTLVDRCTRYTFMAKIPFKTAENTTDAICKLLSSVKAIFKTCTFDNGREFNRHEEIAERLGGDMYFAHPYHSWERGTNENTNGLIRQYFPKNRDFRTITQREITDVQDKLNNRPRKCLGMKTPNQLLFDIDPIVAIGY